MSDDLDTAKLRDLLVKATPGPWRFRHRCVGNEGDPSPGHDEQIGLGWDWSDDNANIPPEPMRGVFALGADAALVMAARNELPALLDRIEALERALLDATAHLAGAASAYRKYARRAAHLGRVPADALFTTRAADFDKAVDRARAALEAK